MIGTRILSVASAALLSDTLVLWLSDGRVLQLGLNDYAWLTWLREATPEQRQGWEIVPSGGGVWWPELDDGVELQPLLDMQSL